MIAVFGLVAWYVQRGSASEKEGAVRTHLADRLAEDLVQVVHAAEWVPGAPRQAWSRRVKALDDDLGEARSGA